MISVAFGLMMDAANPRPYYANPVDERPRRALALNTVRIRRSRACLHRQNYRVIFMHRRTDRAPVPPDFPSPLRAA
jgi:hypothetical protein